MRTCLLITIIAVLTTCNSKKNDESLANEEGITRISKTVIDTPPPPPSGKIDIETFGDLKLGQASAETIKVLGEPDSKGRAIEWSADGLMHQDWVWKAKGLVLNMSYDKADPGNTAIIYTITAQAPCTYKTKAGMGLGSTYAEVQQAYKKDIDPEATDATQITVGSVYGGIIFSFTNDKASRIFVGAEAE